MGKLSRRKKRLQRRRRRRKRRRAGKPRIFLIRRILPSTRQNLRRNVAKQRKLRQALQPKLSQSSRPKVLRTSLGLLSLKRGENLSTLGDTKSRRVQTLSLRVPHRQKKK